MMITPPIAVGAVRKLKGRGRSGDAAGDAGWQREASFYNDTFEEGTTFRVHYTESRYHFIWSVIADRVALLGADSVLDIGCGSGQLSVLLFDRGVQTYRGVDFAEKRIEWGRRHAPSPGFRYDHADVFETDLTDPADVVICTEFLEHIENDLGMFEQIPAGRPFIGSVPNFPARGHVRYFANAEEVTARYEAVLDDLRVDTLKGNNDGSRIYFLLSGVTREHGAG